MRKLTHSVGRIAIAVLVSTIMLAAAKAGAKAASDEVTFDYSQGDGYTVENTYTETDPSMAQLPVADKQTMLWARLARFYNNLEKNPRSIRFNLSANPEQAIVSDETFAKYITIKASAGSKGTFETTYTESKLRKMYDGMYPDHSDSKRDKWVQDVFDTARYTYGVSAKTPTGEQYIKVKVLFPDSDSVYVEVGEDETANVKYYPTEFTAGGVKYKVVNREATVTGLDNKKAKSVTIPETVSYDRWSFNVTAIDSKAFYSCKKLKKVSIKSTGIKSIGKNAFRKKTKNLVIRVPKAQYKNYKTMFKKAGMKSIKIKALKG